MISDKTPLFDIVIPSYGRPDRLREGLVRISEAQGPQLRMGCVIVVENGGKCGVKEICDKFNHHFAVRYIYRAEAGVSAARHEGALSSSAPFVIFFDNDIQVDSGTLLVYQDAFVRHGETAFFGGRLYPIYEVEPEEWLKPFLPFSVTGFSLGDEECRCNEPVFMGGNIAFSRSSYERAGGFEGPGAIKERAGGIGEENRLQQRALDLGCKGIYLPMASVGHPVSATSINKTFALHRIWRRGFTTGTIDANQSEHSKLLMGVPFRAWLELFHVLLRLRTVINPFKTTSKRFIRLMKLYEILGVITGYRSARR